MKIVQITFDCPDDETYLQVLGISKSFKEQLSGFAEVNIKEVESTPAEDWVKVDTVGKILKRQMETHGLIVDTVDKELKLLSRLQRLIDDEIYTNSIPIMLFINLLKSLHITFDEIEPLMLPTFKVVLSKETEESIKKKKAGYGLWECEEAIEKYTKRLKELITT